MCKGAGIFDAVLSAIIVCLCLKQYLGAFHQSDAVLMIELCKIFQQMKFFFREHIRCITG